MSRNSTQWTARPNLPMGQYVDSRVYADEQIFNEEKEKIFNKVWLVACHESEVPEPLDFRTYQHPGGHNIIVVRGEDNIVRAFFNVCPHRGNTLVYEPAGSLKPASPSGGPNRLTCIFHAWAFNTKGECVDIPREEAGYQNRIKKCDVGLREVRVEVAYGGFVWVNTDDSAPGLADYLGGALDAIGDTLSEPLEVFHYHRAVIPGNFKMWHDTNSEFYHDYMHYHNRITGMMQPGYWDREYRSFPGGHAQVTDMQLKYEAFSGHAERSLGWPGLGPNRWALVDLFPGITYNIRAPAMRLDTAIPLGPNLVLIEFRGLGLKADTPEERAIRVKDHNSIWGPFGRNLPEDLLGTLGQGRALSRNDEAPYVLHARQEGNKIHDEVGMRHFYQEWARRMGRNPSDPYAAVSEDKIA
ncbi:Methanesulfonate monooxygenase, hydroxylase alpha subunit [Stutzerimonas xanthomarina]|nr:Methanesulfonate monooxygenase, hydroxylase alpha subunit [Stutzerimonas xanthomarina]